MAAASTSPTGSVTHAGRLPVKAAVARYDGDMFRRLTPTATTQVNGYNIYSTSSSIKYTSAASESAILDQLE